MLRLSKSLLSALLRILKSAVFNFDTNRSAILDVSEGREKLVPLDVAKTGKLGNMPPETHHPSIIESVGNGFIVFCMYVNDSILEFMQRPNVVDPLPDQMRWIKVEAKMFAGNRVEHSTPDVRRNREVLSAGPFIAAEQHRTIFDPNLDVMICGKRNQWLPNRLEKLPILFHGLKVIPADKCGHHANSQDCGCRNHPAKVLAIVFAFDWVSA